MKKRIYGLETEFGIEPSNSEKNKWFLKERSFLPNGGRFYIDIIGRKEYAGMHPEYATPECSDLRQLIMYDKAGEIIVQQLIPEASIFKHNCDYDDATFGCHENYFVNNNVFNQNELEKIVSFLVTRQIFAGAGKIKPENSNKPVYSISQRADYIMTIFNFATVDKDKRPIINTRDEPHTNIGRRLHLILGDSNMSQTATYLKVGTTSLVLDLLEDGLLNDCIRLENPVEALHHISEDSTYKWIVRTKSGKTISAIDVQRDYLAKAMDYYDNYYCGEETNYLLDLWDYVLDMLKKDYTKLDTILDWVIKENMFNVLMENDGYLLDINKIRSIELQYHNVNREESLFYFWQKENGIKRLINNHQIIHATNIPPLTTRAWIRGNLIKEEFNTGKEDLKGEWGRIITPYYWEIPIPDPFNNYNELLKKLVSQKGKVKIEL